MDSTCGRVDGVYAMLVPKGKSGPWVSLAKPGGDN